MVLRSGSRSSSVPRRHLVVADAGDEKATVVAAAVARDEVVERLPVALCERLRDLRQIDLKTADNYTSENNTKLRCYDVLFFCSKSSGNFFQAIICSVLLSNVKMLLK